MVFAIKGERVAPYDWYNILLVGSPKPGRQAEQETSAGAAATERARRPLQH